LGHLGAVQCFLQTDHPQQSLLANPPKGGDAKLSRLTSRELRIDVPGTMSVGLPKVSIEPSFDTHPQDTERSFAMNSGVIWI
jgi:hypothetical protein